MACRNAACTRLADMCGSVQERKDHVLQKLVLGTHTSEGEQNYLMVRPASASHTLREKEAQVERLLNACDRWPR